MLKAIIIFSVMSLLNVMLNTVKTIIMYKQNKLSSSLINAITYGVYCFIVVLMAGEMNLWIKIAITAITNFIGVWWSMWILDKFRKDKLWEIKASFKQEDCGKIAQLFKARNISYQYIETLGKHCAFTIYSQSHAESSFIKEIINEFNGKYCVSESLKL